MAQELIIQVYDNTASGALPLQIIETQISESTIFVEIQEDYAPVQSVNGKIGWVIIDKNDVGLSNVENISITGVSGHLQNEIDNISGNLSGYYPNTNPNNFISSGPPTGVASIDVLLKYITGIQTGITSYDGVFPNIYFTETPVVFLSLSYENTEATSINGIAGTNRYVFDITYKNQTGFGVIFSNEITETGINLNVLAYGKGVNI